VLFDKIASVYFLFEKYIYILALEMASAWEPALCQLYQHTCVRRSMVDYLHINALTLSSAIFVFTVTQELKVVMAQRNIKV